jgi:hypothetical protein
MAVILLLSPATAGDQSLARTSHQISTAEVYPVPAARSAVSLLDQLHEYTCAGLGLEASSGPRLRRLATKSGEKCCLAAEFQKEKPDEAVRVTLEKRVSVRSALSPSSEVIETLNRGDTLDVVDYHPKEDAYSVKIGNRRGFINAGDVKTNQALKSLIQRANEAQLAIDEASKANRRAAETKAPLDNETAKRMFLTMRYGEKIANAIMENRVWEGMNKEMVVLSLGKPKSVKKRVFPNIVYEQWEYDDGLYLFFENDVLKHHGGPPWKDPPQ